MILVIRLTALRTVTPRSMLHFCFKNIYQTSTTAVSTSSSKYTFYSQHVRLSDFRGDLRRAKDFPGGLTATTDGYFYLPVLAVKATVLPRRPSQGA